MHARFSILSCVSGVVSQQSEPLRFSVRSFGCALFYLGGLMKVKVRKIAAPYTDVPTESLQAILRNHAHDKLRIHIGTNQLYDIMDVLAKRYVPSGHRIKSSKETWAEFVQHYMPQIFADPSEADFCEKIVTPYMLTPSLGGAECLGSGNWPGYECQCCDCDWYATICFPDELE